MTQTTVREHAEEWFTKPDRIAVCGFSAGGHLSASLGVWYDNPVFTEVYGKADNLRPDAMILCYPVITADQFAHAQSIESVSGSPFGTEEYRRFGLNQYVNDQTPPTFLWHSASDQAVPVENSLKMAEALSRHHVPYELHGLLLHPDAPPLLDTLIIPAIDTCAYRGLISVSLRQFRTTWDSLGQFRTVWYKILCYNGRVKEDGSGLSFVYEHFSTQRVFRLMPNSLSCN